MAPRSFHAAMSGDDLTKLVAMRCCSLVPRSRNAFPGEHVSSVCACFDGRNYNCGFYSPLS